LRETANKMRVGRTSWFLVQQARVDAIRKPNMVQSAFMNA